MRGDHGQRREMRWERLGLIAVLFALPVLMGQERCASSAEGFFSEDPAPSLEGTWQVTYDNEVDVEIDLGGGAMYYGTVSDVGGQVGFNHDGEPVDLDLDCTQDWVVCPSEIWTSTVEFRQPRFDLKPHQVQMIVSEQDCLDPRMPVEAEGECSSDPADDLPCDVEICDPENVVTIEKSTIGSISDPDPENPELGDHPAFTMGVWLNGGWVIPAANCLLLGTSYADADIVYTGDYDPEPEAPTMFATDLTNGVITIDLGGACFWGGYLDTEMAGALLGARIRLTTGFTASMQ